MTTEDTGSSTPARLISVPGIITVGVLGVVVVALSRLLGAETIFREMITEALASVGNAILLLAIFGVLFRTGLERLLRKAPGGDELAQSAKRLQEILQDADEPRKDADGGYAANLERLEGQVSALRAEIEALRKLMVEQESNR